MEGKTVNGYVTSDGNVAVNVDSSKSLNTVVGHEITHILEGTELYDALHQSIVAYAKAKGDYDGRYKSIEKLYEGIEGADINKELTADLVGDYLFTDENFIRNLSTEQPGVFKKVYDEIKYLCKVATAGSKEARELEKIKKTFSDIYRDSGKAQKNTTEEGGVRYALGENNGDTNNQRITINMTDSERARILENKKILAPSYDGLVDETIKKENLENDSKRNFIRATLIKIGEEFDVFTSYKIEDVGVEVVFSKSNINESINKKANPIQLAKLFPVLKESVENSVGIEMHANRYYYDNTTSHFENLLGGYIDGEYFIPVRFGLKHIKGGSPVLYVVVDQNAIETNKIETGVVKTTTLKNDGSAVSRSISKLKLSQIIPFVKSEDVLRYLPDDMLSQEQQEIKENAIESTNDYTNEKNDKKYLDFLNKGNMQAVQQMVNEAAKANGYTIKAYHGTPNGGFTVFNEDKIGSNTDDGIYGSGFYFSTHEN